MGTSSTITTLIVLAALQSVVCDVSPDPKSFFPDINGNLTEIVWAHAVNSQAALLSALSSNDVMMLEADVVIGKLNITGNTTNFNLPIMAHPPATESDLSLEEFIENVIIYNNKGFKLDFKSIEAFEQSKAILKTYRQNLTVPVFINADILPGPVNATGKPVDAKSLLTGVAEIFPESTLSVGWTTRYGTDYNITEGRYTTEQIQSMIDVLKEQKVSQPVTYPVRAGLAANDVSAMRTLLRNSTAFANATLTIWSSEGDHVDADKLSTLIKTVGVDKVYVDVPKDLWKQLNISGASSTFSSSSILAMTLITAMTVLVVSRML